MGIVTVCLPMLRLWSLKISTTTERLLVLPAKGETLLTGLSGQSSPQVSVLSVDLRPLSTVSITSFIVCAHNVSGTRLIPKLSSTVSSRKFIDPCLMSVLYMRK
jgi:hypothetical protein